MRAGSFIVTVIAGLVTSSCMVGPDYVKKKVPTAPAFAELSPSENTNPPPADWWKTFHDPELEKLIEKALRQNYDLRIAYSHLRQARFQRNIAAADLFPQVDADAGAARTLGSKNVVLPLGGSAGSGGSGNSSGSQNGKSKQAATSQGDPPGDPPSQSQSTGSQPASSGASAQNDSAFDDQISPLGKGGLPGKTTDLYQVGFDANWEIDVFGGKRRQVEAANADMQAAREERRGVALTIMAEVARNYFELRGLQMRLEIARRNFEAQSNVVELTRSAAKSGLASDTDTVRAKAQMEVTAATIPPLAQQTRTIMLALCTLVGQPAGSLECELANEQLQPPAQPGVSVGLPSDLIERRPDIREAERRIKAANARIGSAKADLFPKFALIASTGLDSSSIQHLFDWDSHYFLISPTVTWRIFDAGRIFSNIRLQRAMTDEAELRFQSTVLQALEEVESALVAYASEQEHLNRLMAADRDNAMAFELMRERYEQGLVSFLEVLDAERAVFASQDQVAQSDTEIRTDLVALYKALGGGWK